MEGGCAPSPDMRCHWLRRLRIPQAQEELGNWIEVGRRNVAALETRPEDGRCPALRTALDNKEQGLGHGNVQNCLDNS